MRLETAVLHPRHYFPAAYAVGDAATRRGSAASGRQPVCPWIPRTHLKAGKYAPSTARIEPVIDGDQVGTQFVAIEFTADVAAVLALVKTDLRIQRQDRRLVGG